MLHIAGGILLALLILALLPYAGLLLGFVLVAGAVVAAGFFLLGTESGRVVALSVVAICVGWYLLALAFKFLAWLVTGATSVTHKTKDAGGLLGAIDNFFFELRPAFTEKQKIQKLAGRKIRLEEARHAKLYREEQARDRAEKARIYRQERAEEALKRKLTKANDRLIKDVRYLERKFSGVVNLQFQYAIDGINVFTMDHAADAWTKVVSMRCKKDPSTDRVIYELDASPQFFPKGTDTYFLLTELIIRARDILRRAAAESIAANQPGF